VLKGTIRAYYGEKSYLLEEGDSILWNGTVPHRIENVGDSEAQLLIALTPPGYLPLEHTEEVDAGARQPGKGKQRGKGASGHARGRAAGADRREPAVPPRRPARHDGKP
jgi:hypothetical protein